jgi:hypothetical protein
MNRMKKHPFITVATLAAVISIAHGQGTVIYDQQSSDEHVPGESLAGIQANEPIGQSFTPALSAIGFIRLELYDGLLGNGRGATIYLNLRTTSITGTVLAATEPAALADGFNGGFADFYFSVPVGVNPGSVYFFQPVVQTGDPWAVGRFISTSNYLGGTEFLNGIAGNNDLWFREGIIVPEPSVFGWIGPAIVLYASRKGFVCVRNRSRQRH